MRDFGMLSMTSNFDNELEILKSGHSSRSRVTSEPLY